MILLAALICAGQPISSAEALHRADELYALFQEDGDGARLVESVHCLSAARRGLFDADGHPVAIDVTDRLSEAHRAAADDPRLLARLKQVEADRGHVDGPLQMASSLIVGPGWQRRIAFRGDAPAVIYLRAAGPVRLTVRSASGRTICSEQRRSGRILCKWRPQRTAPVDVLITQADPVAAPVTFQLFTN